MDFSLPELGEGVYEAELVRWLVKPGDTVKRGQALLEVMTDKATMEVPAPFVGTISSLNAEAGAQVKVGAVVLTYEGSAAAGSAEKMPAENPAPAPVVAAPAARSANGPAAPPAPAPAAAPVRAAPSVRHLARKLGVDLARVRGTGPGGRILIDDLAGAIPAAAANGVRPPAALALDLGVAATRIKMAGLRRAVAQQMVRSKQAIPHYAYIDEVDVSDLVRVRNQAADHFQAAGIKLTYLPFFVRAAVRALQEVPLVNATYDEEAGEIVLHDRYDIGIAVATPGGLIVPVIRAADQKDLGQIAREIERLSGEARGGRARREDLTGGTFTLTSIGGIGGLISTPIINHPQVGILGIGKIVKRPVYDDAGQIRPADLVYLSLSLDHRVVDGAVGAVFGNALAKHLTRPAALLL